MNDIVSLCEDVIKAHADYENDDQIHNEDLHMKDIEEKERELFAHLQELYGEEIDLSQRYYSSTEISRMTGWSRQRVHINMKKGRIPKPDLYYWKKPLWSKERVDEIVGSIKELDMKRRKGS